MKTSLSHPLLFLICLIVSALPVKELSLHVRVHPTRNAAQTHTSNKGILYSKPQAKRNVLLQPPGDQEIFPRLPGMYGLI